MHHGYHLCPLCKGSEACELEGCDLIDQVCPRCELTAVRNVLIRRNYDMRFGGETVSEVVENLCVAFEAAEQRIASPKLFSIVAARERIRNAELLLAGYLESSTINRSEVAVLHEICSAIGCLADAIDPEPKQ